MKGYTPPKGRKSPQYRGEECLNCGQVLNKSDAYCPNCGQLNSVKKLSLGDYLKEFILSVFVYDSKFRYTITDLLFHPGRVSLNYSNGKRARYANPFRFFLSVSIVYFLLAGVINFLSPPANSLTNNQENRFRFGSKDKTAINDSISWGKSREILPSHSEINSPIKNQIAKAKKEDTVKTNYYSYISPESVDSLGLISGSLKKILLFSEFYSSTEIKSPDKAMDSLHYPNTRFNLWLYSRNSVWERISNDPAPFIDYLKTKIPFFLFFFTPLFAIFFSVIYFKRKPFMNIFHKMTIHVEPVVKNLFPKNKVFKPAIVPFVKALSATAALPGWLLCVERKFNYMDHVIFIFHIFTFMFLVLLFCEIPDYLLGWLNFNNPLANIFLMLVAPFYFYKALRNFYGERRFLTIVKFFFLTLVFFVVGGMFAAVFFGATMVAY